MVNPSQPEAMSKPGDLSARRMAPEVGFGGVFPYIFLKVNN
jgi:hypothetical protein